MSFERNLGLIVVKVNEAAGALAGGNKAGDVRAAESQPWRGILHNYVLSICGRKSHVPDGWRQKSQRCLCNFRSDI
jgi:hypothetical protein